MQELYAEPIQDDLIGRRIEEMKAGGVDQLRLAHAPTRRAVREAGPGRRARHPGDPGHGRVGRARLDPSGAAQPEGVHPAFDIPVIVGGCASYSTALHLMRTGAVGVLVGVGPGNACTTRGVLGVGVPQATAIADAAGARMRHLHETGRYCPRHRRRRDADRRRHRQGHRLWRRRRHDRLAAGPADEAPGRGYHWGMATFHPTLPRGARVRTQQVASIGRDPARARPRERRHAQPVRRLGDVDGDLRLRDIKEFQKAE